METLGIVPDSPLPCWGWGGMPDQTAHSSTLFTVFEPDVRVAELRDAGT